MTTFRHLFLDLEETIITAVVDGWHTAEIINLDKIQRIIEQFNPDAIHIFSFAIWNERELTLFDIHVREMVEKAIGRKINQVFIVDNDVTPICCEVKKIQPSTVDFAELCAFWGKGEAFRLVMRHRFSKSLKDSDHRVDVLLVDDVVWDERWEWPDLKVRGQLLNIKLFK
jgi:hypothetical protein